MKKGLIVLILSLASVLVLYFYLKNDFPRAVPTLYYNGTFITVNDKQPVANAMLVIDGKIEAIGDTSAMNLSSLNGLQKRDLQGATVLPGFIDIHTHFALSLYLNLMHDLSGFTYKTNKELRENFERIIRNAPEDEWLLFRGLDPILTHDLEIPSIQYMDSIAPNIPIIILSHNLHSYYANSKAFEKAGITPDTKDPSEHSYYERDSLGNFTGKIYEQAAFIPISDKVSEEVLSLKHSSMMAEKVMQDYAKKGHTTIVSTGLTIADDKPLMLINHLSGEENTLIGGLLDKIGMFPDRQPLPRHFIYMRYDRLHLLPPKREEKNDFYDMIGIKLWYDGSAFTGSMYLDSPYVDSKLTSETLGIPKNSRGDALLHSSDLKAYIRKYHTDGWQIAIHTQGDAAIEEVVATYKELSAELDFSQSRHRLEHCSMLLKSQLENLKQLGLTPSFHILYLRYYGDALQSDIIGAKRASEMLPVRSSIDKGLVVSLHSDQPMFESLPFELIQTAVNRNTLSGDTIGADETISLMDAIKTVTINAAWQISMEDKIGSLEEGKYADFIILDQNPFEVSADKIDQIKCLETFVHGNKVAY